MTRRIVLVLAVALLASCIGIESGIRLRQDGSGELILSYKISQFLKELDVGREDKRLPLPVSEEEFRRTASSIEDLRLLDIDQSEDEENVYIKARLEFDSIEALNELGQAGESELSLESSGETSVFRQVISSGQNGEQVTEDSLKMIETFFEGYELSYKITTPRDVLNHSLGTLSEDRRTVTYTVSVAELLQESEPLVLEVVW